MSRTCSRRGPRPQRRFARRAFVPPVVRRSAPEITEGTAQGAVNVREGLYRRTLAAADALAAFVALALVVVWDAGADLEPWVLLAMPVAVFVAKVGGLYERDELVLKKTTLDEAPALLQITGLFALLVFLGQNVFVHAGLTPPLVAELWLASFFAIFARPRGRPPRRRLALAPRALPGHRRRREPSRTVRGKLEDGSRQRRRSSRASALDALAPRDRRRALPRAGLRQRRRTA